MTENLAANISGVDYESLPQTFKDAMDFIIKLDIPHVWIVSLRIIQDDKEDWERECRLTTSES